MLWRTNACGEKRRFFRSPESSGWAARMRRARSAMRRGRRAVRTISASTISGATASRGSDQGSGWTAPAEKPACVTAASRSSCASSTRSAPSGRGAWAGSASAFSSSSRESSERSSSSSSASSGGSGGSATAASAGGCSGRSARGPGRGIGPRGPFPRGSGARSVARSTASEGISPTRTCASSASNPARCRSASFSPRRSR